MTLIRTLAVLSVSAVCSVMAALAAASPADARDGEWGWPLEPMPPVAAAFVPPMTQWGAGHRGVDLAGATGQQVLAVGPGVVTVAGDVAGRGVVVVDHGTLRSSYEPVRPGLQVGEVVTTGQLLGTLELASSHCWPEACLHLGIRRGDRYLDPLLLLGPRPVRLKPLDEGQRQGFRAPATKPVGNGRIDTASVNGPDPPSQRRNDTKLAVGLLAAALLAAAVGRQARGWA